MTLPDCRSVKVVFTDIDGTLLNSSHGLPARAPAVAQALLDKGVQLVPATGKTRTCLKPVLRELFPHRDVDTLPGVYVNGCSAFAEGGQQVSEGGLLAADVAAVCRAAEKQGREVVAFCLGDVLLASVSGFLSEDLVRYGEASPKVADIAASAAGGLVVHKLIVNCGRDIAAERAAVADGIRRESAAAADRCVVTNAVQHQLEVVPAGVNKGTAVLSLLRQMGLRPEHAVAFGDGSNDVPMFEALGRERSVAMKNAGAAPRAAAGHQTALTNDEDGELLALAQMFSLSHPKL
eukprot:TRINITY_DN8014_c0_g1_i1.p3 TRINITY_DN8014_c0_g1~~TRINITY_DN8014_c0_g1_i1.p3  ORF type:complete len:292 (+),score=97.88 TRINITY_DN8014_c0_g1_i1:67-942(+)